MRACVYHIGVTIDAPCQIRRLPRGGVVGEGGRDQVSYRTVARFSGEARLAIASYDTGRINKN